jgi:hypothetical protein
MALARVPALLGRVAAAVGLLLLAAHSCQAQTTIYDVEGMREWLTLGWNFFEPTGLPSCNETKFLVRTI